LYNIPSVVKAVLFRVVTPATKHFKSR